MHTININNGWEQDTLSDDSDKFREASKHAQDCINELERQHNPNNYLLNKLKRILEMSSGVLIFRNEDEEKELSGCVSQRYLKNNHTFYAMIEYTERKHNEQIIVRGSVFKRNGDPHKENTLEDVLLFRWNRFDGQKSKTQAAIYAHTLVQEIDRTYFYSDKSQLYLPFME